jgi:hypothetical protein
LREHELKTHPEPFAAVLGKRKKHEIRTTTDRVFQTGDILILEEWDPNAEKYTGRAIIARVTYITMGGQWGIPPDLCVMSIDPYGFEARHHHRGLK